MLFKDKLDEIRLRLEPEFEKLFQSALQNQSHDGDVLLIALNGWHNPKLAGMTTTDGHPYSQYVIGPGSEGHSDATHYEFIHNYRKDLYKLPLPEYLKLHEWSSERKGEIDKLLREEEMTIHLETLIYLKIWEGDFLIKTWYQFVQVLKGERYNWSFKIKNSNRDAEGIATRQELIRKDIRDELKVFSEPIYDTFKQAYLTQVRNAIGHSSFSFLGRNMHLHNYVEADPSSQLTNVTFDEWIEMFHTTIMLHNFYIWLKNRINQFYGNQYVTSGVPIEVRITEKDGVEKFSQVVYRPEFQDWRWASQLTS